MFWFRCGSLRGGAKLSYKNGKASKVAPVAENSIGSTSLFLFHYELGLLAFINSSSSSRAKSRRRDIDSVVQGV